MKHIKIQQLGVVLKGISEMAGDDFEAYLKKLATDGMT